MRCPSALVNLIERETSPVLSRANPIGSNNFLQRLVHSTEQGAPSFPVKARPRKNKTTRISEPLPEVPEALSNMSRRVPEQVAEVPE
eukprot:4338048-Pyramimonas_sp.AAC.1